MAASKKKTKPNAKMEPAAPVATPSAPSFSAATTRVTVLESEGLNDLEGPGDEIEIGPPTFFAVMLTAPIARRYLYLLQKETGTDEIVVLGLFDRESSESGGEGLRFPPSPAWARAIVDGTVHVLGANRLVSRREIVAFIGGHQPPPKPTKPPYT